MLKNIFIKKLIIATSIAIALIIFINSCSKSPKCWGENKNKGIIEKSADIRCEPMQDIHEFAITDDSSYKKVFTNRLTGELTCDLPSFDFEKYTLLGQYADGQCETKFIREVFKEESLQRYHYKVTVKNCGACKSSAYSYNWVLVPKLENGWTVSFEVDEK